MEGLLKLLRERLAKLDADSMANILGMAGMCSLHDEVVGYAAQRTILSEIISLAESHPVQSKARAPRSQSRKSRSLARRRSL